MDKSCALLPLKSKAEIARFAKRQGVTYNRKTDSLQKEYAFTKRQDGELFVGMLLWLANKLWHHPNIHVAWNTVTVTLRTHDSDGITQKDFEFFEQLHTLNAIESICG